MRFNQITILKEENPDTNLTIEAIIGYGKELFGSHMPYSIRKDIAGEDVILFNAHYVGCMRQALTDGCVARMSKHELKFWYEFVEYQNDVQDGVRDDLTTDVSEIQASVLQRERALYEMDAWISDELAGIEHPEEKECYTPYIGEV